MRRVFLSLLGLTVFWLAGCDSMPTRMRERFEAPTPKTQDFPGDQRVVFEAAQLALKRMDFQVSRAKAAQGLIKAHSALHTGDSFGTARQYTLELKFYPFGPGRTGVDAFLREQEESASFAGATDLPIKEHGLYVTFFATLEQILTEPPAK